MIGHICHQYAAKFWGLSQSWVGRDGRCQPTSVGLPSASPINGLYLALRARHLPETSRTQVGAQWKRLRSCPHIRFVHQRNCFLFSFLGKRKSICREDISMTNYWTNLTIFCSFLRTFTFRGICKAFLRGWFSFYRLNLTCPVKKQRQCPQRLKARFAQFDNYIHMYFVGEKGVFFP